MSSACEDIPDDFVTASIEFAAEHLGVPLLMGHGHEKLPGHLPPIIRPMKPAADKARSLSGDLLSDCVRRKELVQRGKLVIVGARNHVHSGRVQVVTE